MKEKRGGAVDRYLSLLDNNSLRSTDPPAQLHVFLLLLHHPQHLQFIMLDHESIKRRRRGEEERLSREEEKDAGRTRAD